MKRDYLLISIVIFALLIRLVFAFSWHELWWDSGVYVGMGKYAFSSGSSGLWEHIRPPLVPLILGLFWKLGLDPVLVGRLFEIFLMAGVVYFTFKLAEFWFDRKVAVFSSLLVALSPILYHLSFHQYTEIPSMFFVLSALWLFIHKRFFWAGVLTGLAFLAKFPSGIFLVVLLAVILLYRQFFEAFKVAAGFAVISVPYLLWSWHTYGSPFLTLLAARETIGLALGCNVLRAKSWWFYFWVLPFSESLLYFFAIIGIYALYRRWDRKHLVWVLSLLLPLMYLVQLSCRDYRYVTLFIPFAAMLASLGIVWVIDLFPKKRRRVVFVISAVLALFLLCFTALTFFQNNARHVPISAEEQYFHFLENRNINGEVWVSNPSVAAFTDMKLNKIYYPIYNETLVIEFDEYFDTYGNKIGAVMLDNCGGGLICHPDDSACEKNTQDLIDKIDARMHLALDVQHGRCWYKVWVKN